MIDIELFNKTASMIMTAGVLSFLFLFGPIFLAAFGIAFVNWLDDMAARINTAFDRAIATLQTAINNLFMRGE